MSETTPDIQSDLDSSRATGPSERSSSAAGLLAGRLALLLERVLPEKGGPMSQAISFLRACAAAAGEAGLSADRTGAMEPPWSTQAPDPLDRLVESLGLSPLEVDLLVLAGLPEEHEGYADVLRALHPRGESRPCVGLAAQLLCPDPGARRVLREYLCDGSAVRAGVILLEGEAPFFGKSLVLASALWPVLHGQDVWPDSVGLVHKQAVTYGLESWLEQPGCLRARRALQEGSPCHVLVTADAEETALDRAAALMEACCVPAAFVKMPESPDRTIERLIGVHALARGQVPVLGLSAPEGRGAAQMPTLAEYPGPIVVCARTGTVSVRTERPLIEVACPSLSTRESSAMWAHALPALSRHARILAGRYPLEPALAQRVVTDLRQVCALEQREANLADLAACVRARTALVQAAGARLVRPQARWDQLILPAERIAQLRNAVDRSRLQATVLDEWGFLAGRRGARGVRLLFAGPPGTGKTLASEVLAQALEVELLVVDLSRVVSKWIGETEKHLAAIFDSAERYRAVLVFDEADALFGKRTEVADAHDRYANLETAYLLARLERFEGMTILTTNLRQNIDPAFTRRLEDVVEFTEPNQQQRLALWQCHLPAAAPRGPDVDLDLLASLYPLVGGLIRNACLSAGFMAAAEDQPIQLRHLVQSIRREYDKAGRAFPGAPPGLTKTERTS
jgi:hypothetical protein